MKKYKNDIICDDTFDMQAERDKIRNMSDEEFEKYLKESDDNEVGTTNQK